MAVRDLNAIFFSKDPCRVEFSTSLMKARVVLTFAD